MAPTSAEKEIITSHSFLLEHVTRMIVAARRGSRKRITGCCDLVTAYLLWNLHQKGNVYRW